MAKTYNTLTSDVTAGSVLTATLFNQVQTNVRNYRVPPMVALERTSDVTVTNNTDITWTTTPVYDTDGMFVAGSPTRITPTTAGVYLVTLQLSISASTLASPYAYIGRNGSLNYASAIFGVDAATARMNLSITASMNGTTDYFTAGIGWASATGTVTLQGTTNDARRARISATWLGQSS